MGRIRISERISSLPLPAMLLVTSLVPLRRKDFLH